MSLHRNRGAKRAREARAKLGLDPAAPLPCLLDCVEERAGLRVVVAALPDHVAGACTDGELLWVNGREAPVRQRFTLAHELGHAWCRHDGRLAVDTFATLRGSTDTREIEANAFAGEFLIPRVAVERLATTRPTLDDLVVLAAGYGTSAAMTLIRLKQFGGVSPEHAARLTAEIDAFEHHAAFERLGCTPLPDRLGRLGALPYLSPPLAGSRLAAVLSGDAEAEPGLARAIARMFGG